MKKIIKEILFCFLIIAVLFTGLTYIYVLFLILASLLAGLWTHPHNETKEPRQLHFFGCALSLISSVVLGFLLTSYLKISVAFCILPCIVGFVSQPYLLKRLDQSIKKAP